MKKSVILFLAVLAMLSAIQIARADTIADWTFESLVLSTTYTNATPNGQANNIAADVGSGTASEVHATAGAIFSTPSGNGSTKSLSANNWSLNDYYQFTASTVGFTGITISYDEVGSATGPKTFALQYSTDGSIFTQFGSSYSVLSSPSWSPSSGVAGESYADDLSLITALNGLSTAYFRVVDLSATTGGAINGGNVGTAGTDRIDNFIISGTPVPEPATLTLAAVCGTACLAVFRRKK